MRTHYTASIEFTAREKQALERFLNRATVEGDVSLVEGVVRLVLIKSVIESQAPSAPSTDLHRE